jgi:outer membrane immunogenic protein
VRSSILVIGLGIAINGQVFAADLRRPVLAPAAPQTDWSGFYVGGNIGYGWNHAVLTDSFSAPGFGQLGITTVTTENLNGPVWGGQVGYNWQVGKVVLGLETDLNATRQIFNQPSACNVGGAIVPGCTVYPTDRIQWFGTLRGRVGVAMDRWLLYATGGAAWQNLRSDGQVTVAGAGGWDIFSTSTTRFGYSVGAGVETALLGKWSLGLEYLFLDTGTKTTVNTALPAGLSAAVGAPPGTAVYETHRLADQIVRLRLNFRP